MTAKQRDFSDSPNACARVGGVFYLIIIVFGFFGEALVRGRLVVWGDAAATAERIQASELLWRWSVAGELAMLICVLGLALVFYVLLRPVHRDLALLAVFFNLVSITLEAANKLHLLATLAPLSEDSALGTVPVERRQAWTYLSVKAHEQGFGVSLIFFGGVCILVGRLIFRSSYLPKTLGVLMQIAGVCYLINSFALIVSPPLSNRLFPAILLPALVGEASLCFWFLAKGVDLRAWRARVGASSRE